jgi:hypothetical protein
MDWRKAGEAWTKTPLADRAAAGAWAGVALFTLLVAILIVHVSAYGAPYWDHWGYTDPARNLQELFGLHNGHPLVIGRLLFVLDNVLFDARGGFLIAMILLSLALIVAAFVGLARISGLRAWATVASVAALATTITFNPQGWENLRWGWEIAYVMEFTATVGAAYALGSYALAPRAWKLVLSLVCSAIAIVSLANGVVAAVLLVLLAMYLKLPRRVVLLHIAVALLAFPVLTGPGDSDGPRGEFSAPQAFAYVLRYLGGGLGGAFSGDGVFSWMNTSLVVGAVMVLASLGAAVLTLRRSDRDPLRASMLMLMLYIGATACLTAIGRAFLGDDQALSSRYAISGHVLVVALVLFYVVELRERVSSKTGALVALAAAAAALLIPLKGLTLAHNLAGRARGELAGQTALVVNVRDEEAIKRLAYNVEMAMRVSQELRQTGKWHFSDRWSRAIGERHDFSDAGQCAGQAAAERPPGADYLRLSGFVPADASWRGRIVVVAHEDGLISGYGRLPNHASDLLGGLIGPALYDWQGHARLEGEAPSVLVAYLASRRAIVCRIGVVQMR